MLKVSAEVLQTELGGGKCPGKCPAPSLRGKKLREQLYPGMGNPWMAVNMGQGGEIQGGQESSEKVFQELILGLDPKG